MKKCFVAMALMIGAAVAFSACGGGGGEDTTKKQCTVTKLDKEKGNPVEVGKWEEGSVPSQYQNGGQLTADDNKDSYKGGSYKVECK